METSCFVCKKKLNIKPSKIKEKNFCSIEHYYIFQRGKKLSKETKEKMSKSHMGKEPFNKGKSLIELHGCEKAKEIKEKISQGTKKMWNRPGFKENFSKQEFYKSKEYKEKMSDSLKEKWKNSEHPSAGKKLTDDHKKRISETAKNNPNFGMRNKKHSKESKEKMSKARKGKIRIQSDEEKRLRRVHLKEKFDKFEKWHPNFNHKACEYFENFDEENNTKGLYAMSGGEYYIEELGYWVDYINHDLKLIIEWDESKHYLKNGKLRDKDIKRQNEIQNLFADYEFRRIRE